MAGEEVKDGHNAGDPADHDYHNPHGCVAVIIGVKIVDDEEDTLGKLCITIVCQFLAK